MNLLFFILFIVFFFTFHFAMSLLCKEAKIELLQNEIQKAEKHIEYETTQTDDLNTEISFSFARIDALKSSVAVLRRLLDSTMIETL